MQPGAAIQCNDPVTVRGGAAIAQWRVDVKGRNVTERSRFTMGEGRLWGAGPTVRPMFQTNVSAKTRDRLRSWKLFFALRQIAPTPLARRACAQNMTPVSAAGPSNVVTITTPTRSAQLAIAARRQPLARRVLFACPTTRRSTGGSTPRRITYQKTTQRCRPGCAPNPTAGRG